MARYVAASQEHDLRINLLALTDFVYANFDGTLAQWKDFLADPRLHPEALKAVDVSFEYDRRFSYASDRVRLEYGPELQAIRADSVLTLGMAFFEDAGKPVWDVAQLWLSADSTDSSYLAVVRKDTPPPALGDDFGTEWKEVLERRHPFDASMRIADEVTKVSSVVGPPADQSPGVLYTVHYVAQGEPKAETMRTKLELLSRGVRSLER